MSSTSHPTSSESIGDQGVMLWVVTFGTIALWMVHVVAETSLVGYGRSHPWIHWVMHGLTAVLTVLAALATLASRRIVRRHREDESMMSPTGRTAFLGWMGVFIGSCDVTLILIEGLYLVFLHG